MPRIASLLVWVSFGLARLAAQDPRAAPVAIEWRRALVAEVRQQLATWDLALVACGARTAAECQLGECEPELRSQLRRLREGAGDARQCAVESLLDALIETRAVVPAAELAPFASFGEPVVVLAARDPAANRQLLLQLFHPESEYFSGARRACGNLLVALRDRDFVRALLRGPVHVVIEVADAGAVATEPLAYGSLSACGRFTAPDGFPARVCVRLDIGPGDDEHLVAPGPVPVFRFRSSYRPGLNCSSYSFYSEYHAARIGWLTELLGARSEALVAAIDAPTLVVWKDLATLQAAVEQHRRELATRWRELAAACSAAGLVGADVVQDPAPEAKVLTIDSRRDQAVKLPPDDVQPWK